MGLLGDLLVIARRLLGFIGIVVGCFTLYSMIVVGQEHLLVVSAVYHVVAIVTFAGMLFLSRRSIKLFWFSVVGMGFLCLVMAMTTTATVSDWRMLLTNMASLVLAIIHVGVTLLQLLINSAYDPRGPK